MGMDYIAARGVLKLTHDWGRCLRPFVSVDGVVLEYGHDCLKQLSGLRTCEAEMTECMGGAGRGMPRASIGEESGATEVVGRLDTCSFFVLFGEGGWMGGGLALGVSCGPWCPVCAM